MKKPNSFNIAAYCFLTGMGFGLIRDLIFNSTEGVKPEFLYWNPYVFGLISIITLIGFLLISKGLNWVRIVALILFATTIISFFFKLDYLSQELEFSTLSGLLIITSLIFRGSAVYFMFNKPSNEYIKSRKA
ncbi:MAG: hypothetical protein ACSHXL_04805 [Bacteroidota bacterium]